MKAYVEIRSQHSRGSSANQFGGPDTYVAVQIVPHGMERLKQLNRHTALKRGIELIYCGEGYSSRRKTTKSMLGQALAKAKDIAEEVNRAKYTQKTFF